VFLVSHVLKPCLFFKNKTGSELALSSPVMRRVGTGGDGASASKKLRVAEGENETAHVVSMMRMVRGA
jgi:hypothetical protein